MNNIEMAGGSKLSNREKDIFYKKKEKEKGKKETKRVKRVKRRGTNKCIYIYIYTKLQIIT